jgi:hypothetical protein
VRAKKNPGGTMRLEDIDRVESFMRNLAHTGMDKRAMAARGYDHALALCWARGMKAIQVGQEPAGDVQASYMEQAVYTLNVVIDRIGR